MAVGTPAVPHSINSEGLEAPRLHARADPQSQECLSRAVSLGPEARRRGRGARRRAWRRSPSSRSSSTSSASPRAASCVNETETPLRIALVAGETSGDTLGAALIEALRRQFPARRIRRRRRPEDEGRGLRGLARHRRAGGHGTHRSAHAPAAAACGCAAICGGGSSSGGPTCSSASTTRNSTWGSPSKLKRAGLATVQYVSPQVWAWRQGRVRTIGASVDLVLCLFPFEPDFYREHGVRAAFVGHPLADQIPMEVDRAAARARTRDRSARRACSRCCPAAGAAKSKSWPIVFAGAAELLAQRVSRPGQHRAHGDARAARPVCRALRGARARCARCACSTARRAARWRRPTWCWWPRAPRRSRPRCSSGRWWWPTGWAPSPRSCCARSDS